MPSSTRQSAYRIVACAAFAVLLAGPGRSQPATVSPADEAVWRNVTRDRTTNSDYRNLVAHPIQLSVSTRSGTDGKRCVVKLWVSGVEVGYQFMNNASGGGQLCSVTAIIPAKASYRVDTDEAPEVVLELWSELY